MAFGDIKDSVLYDVVYHYFLNLKTHYNMDLNLYAFMSNDKN